MPTGRPQGNTRVSGKEQYYTPRAVADAVVARLIAQHPDAATRPWLEPAGGTGAFVEAAHAAGVTDVISLDIDPRHPAVTHGDFLATDLDLTHAVAVSNPPFGRNNALAVPFFNRAARYADLICFIVPRSWRKWSVINRLDPGFTLGDDYDLDVAYVDAAGAPIADHGLLRTVVQTWVRTDVPRPRIEVLDRNVVERVDPVHADVALTVFGYGCGTVRTDFARTPNTTQMFLRLVHPRALEALRAVDFARFFQRTAYTPALALPEINYLLNEYLFADPGLVNPVDPRLIG